MRYLVTGGSGYIGGRLIDELSGRDETELIVIVDVNAPRRRWPKTQYAKGDVRDRKATRELLRQHRIDTLLHLAFILDPIHDEAMMYDVDVNGTQATLWAASEAGVEHVLSISSASAYGAWPDNPKPIAEDWPVRGAPDFSYARDKAEADRVCQLWAAQHPEAVMTIVRPCIVLGPNVDNYIVNGWLKAPFMPVLDGHDEEFQLVHEDDVVSALIALLDAKAAGPFNLAGDGTMTWRRSGEMIGQRVREISLKNMKRLNSAMWRMRVPNTDAPPGNMNFLRYPWVVSTEKLKSETDWKPRFDTLETFKVAMRAKGKLPAEPRMEPSEAQVA
ncbi:MAG: NAD-dependent epimerase/dehydratase family protein [Actinomycetota bacterium]|nr:NAD-dependent epimerase/dehydratase family protein [Actinomycetota bacterium]